MRRGRGAGYVLPASHLYRLQNKDKRFAVAMAKRAIVKQGSTQEQD
jgi:hypothetical protein